MNCLDCNKYWFCETRKTRNGKVCPGFNDGTKEKDSKTNPENKYNRSVVGLDGVKTTIDIYRVLVAFAVTAPEIQHAAKKILCAGIRGKGNEEQDISEAILSLQKYQERIKQENA